ncbi:MFS transporter [Nocardia sp. 2YAB30]|uniref:MFS transporter n=1 Tax=Nocardia sp. 2YAB30 TaxID=3233022 RepID=UPI003F986CEE
MRGRRPTLVLSLVSVAVFMLMLDTTVVTAALADIRADFDSSIDGLQWVVDAYAIPLAGVLLTFATFGDRFGRKRLFVTGMTVFTASSLALALSGSVIQLNLLRAVQGVGGAMLFATALPLLAVAFPEARERAKAIGVYGAVMAAASVAGPVLGGALVTQLGWRSIFTVNVPIGLVVAGIALVRMPESSRTSGRRTDWLGSLLLIGGLTSGVFALTRGNALGWTSATALTLVGASVVLLAAFAWWQTTTAHPLLDLFMVRKPGFAGTAIVSVAYMGTLMAAANYLAVFMIGAFGLSPLEMGLRLLPISLTAFVAAATIAVLAKRVPIGVSLPITMGMVTLGMWLLGGVEITSDWTHFIPGMVVGGLGLGAITALAQAASLTFAPAEDAGMTSATFATLRQVGMAMGVAGLGALFSSTARDTARSGLAALPGVQSIGSGHTTAFLDAAAAGAGGQVGDAVPNEFATLAPALADVANRAAVDGLNAAITLGTVVGVMATLFAAAAFARDALRFIRP